VICFCLSLGEGGVAGVVLTCEYFARLGSGWADRPVARVSDETGKESLPFCELLVREAVEGLTVGSCAELSFDIEAQRLNISSLVSIPLHLAFGLLLAGGGGALGCLEEVEALLAVAPS